MRRGSTGWRFSAPVVAAIHFAAATFVPVAHPFLHRHPVSGCEAASLSISGPRNDLDGSCGLDACPACLASPGITLPPGGAPEASPRILRDAVSRPCPPGLPARRPGPANRVRAPPLP
jgi:hypothetical protein